MRILTATSVRTRWVDYAKHDYDACAMPLPRITRRQTGTNQATQLAHRAPVALLDLLRHRHRPQPGPHHGDQPQLGVKTPHPEPDVWAGRLQDVQHVSAFLFCGGEDGTEQS